MTSRHLVGNTRQVTVKVISYLFLFLFVYAATSKLMDYESFTIQMAQSPLLTAFAGYLGWIVPLLEIAIGLLLLLPKFRTAALYASFWLMVMFTAYIYIILNFSDFIPCSCGGVLEKLSWTQHLIFNIVFIALAALAIFYTKEGNTKKKLIVLAALAIIGISTIALLFAFSENQVHRNNSFIRRYPHAAAAFNKAIDLHHNSWYLAGIGNGNVYLANSTAPLNVKVLDSSLSNNRDYRIKLDQMDLPFTTVKVAVRPPYFYVVDGNVPVIFRGNTADWKANAIMRDSIFFTISAPIDLSRTAVRFVGAKSNENEIGIIHTQDSTWFRHSNEVLQKQIDGLFDTDGQLLWNKERNQLMYVYFYRNEFLIINTDLELVGKRKTIDTITKAQVVVSSSSEGQLELASPSYPVNKYAATYSKYLYVQSDRLGRFEPKEMLKEASIIDVYNIPKNTYSHSFYIYNYKEKKLGSFMVQGDKLVGIMDRYMVVYDLKSN